MTLLISSAFMSSVHVDSHDVGPYWVSTVELTGSGGIDDPALMGVFETLVFNQAEHGMSELYVKRYATPEAAAIGHTATVGRLSRGDLPLKVNAAGIGALLSDPTLCTDPTDT